MTIQKSSPGIPLSKRCFDIVSSSMVMLVLSPVYILLGLLVWLDVGWPIFFSQERPGYLGNIFRIYKFRSMRSAKPGETGVEQDAARITRFGAFLRSTSLDELPELGCILSGKMSVVGPRPLLKEYLPLYNQQQMRRHDVLPGLTGWAQINGRNALTWEAKFELDTWYVDHWSFWLDMKIILLSIWKVLAREGISQEGEATARAWQGNPPAD
jgi:sugar transferase EpsL